MKQTVKKSIGGGEGTIMKHKLQHNHEGKDSRGRSRLYVALAYITSIGDD